MGGSSIWHWLIVLLIVVLIFGTKKLKNIGSDLGGAVKGFKDGVRDGTASPATRLRRRSRSAPQRSLDPAPSTSKRRRGADAAASVSRSRMIDFGFDKIALIGAVALVVIGPEKLPRVARTVGTLLGKAQRYVADVKAEVNRSIELEELKKMKTEFEDAARNVERSVSDQVHQTTSELGAVVAAAGRHRAGTRQRRRRHHRCRRRVSRIRRRTGA